MSRNAPRMAKLLGGLLFAIAIAGCIDTVESRAVNISNTWTLPQEGFSVFYRYFRDKISWFEADAVCQFHHANLVTVDNGVQFDATRAFLKELDVTSAVWIGLMRPENSARFTWTSSKALDPASGYWAEAIPAMEQPLCAVVDPIRDFRWHALRCGGPETAAFLCELPVPAWAVDCTITSIPSLTVQYMSDSGTVQLSRDCGESGTKHISCQGKQDRDSIIEQLQCSDEEDLASVLATENNNQLLLGPGVDNVATISSTRRPQPPPILEHDILTVVSSNDEESNNKIEVNPNQIEDTVKNVINKFNLQDLMRSEQAALHSDEVDGVPHGVENQRKSGYGKKYSPLYEKKHRYAKKMGSERTDSGDEEDDEDEPMLGDQPMQDETETQPIDIVQQAVKPTADGDYADPAVVTTGVKVVNGEPGTDVISTNPATTPDSRLRRGTDADGDDTESGRTTEAMPGTTLAEVVETTTLVPTVAPTTQPPTTVSSPPPALMTTRTTVASHILPTTPKKEVITGDHFIPPMLLVKARFISARPHTEAPATTMIPTASSTNLPSELAVTDVTPTALTTSDASTADGEQKEASTSTVDPLTSESTSGSSTAGDANQVVDVIFGEQPQRSDQPVGTLTITTRPFLTSEGASQDPGKDRDVRDLPQSAALVSSIQLTQYTEANTATAVPDRDTTIIPSEPSKVANVNAITVNTEELEDVAITTQTVEVTGGSETTSTEPLVSSSMSTAAPPHEPETTSGTAGPNPTEINDPTNAHQDESTSGPSTSPSGVVEQKEHADSGTTPKPNLEPALTGGLSQPEDHKQETSDQDVEHDEHDKHDEDDEEHSELHNSFSNVENYQPYKPNRHRSLTKPEVHNNHGAYIKKILG